MPEALATTKRKFHKLLDTRFGSPSAPAPRPVSQVSQTTVAEPAAKRVRSGASTSSLAATLRRRNVSAASIKSAKPVKEPSFAPWSHDAFVKRLRTFSPVTLWQPKPDQVNEVHWAKRGWSCVDQNTVACKGACEQRLVVNVDPIPKRPRSSDQDTEHDDQDDDEELERALIDKYKELIVDGHSENCLWRQAGCKDDIYRLPVVKASVWQPQLSQRFRSLSAISSSLDSLVLQPNDLSPSPQSLLTDLPPSLLSPPDDAPAKDSDTPTETETKPNALAIAICGWRGATESSTQLLVCDACFQRIGLWMYQPDYKPHVFSADDDHDTTDRYLDLVQLHRDHCPWKNPESQAATGNYAGQPAYKILIDVLARFVDEHRRRAKTASVAVPAAGEAETERGVGEDGRDSVALESMPDLTRQETEKADKERLSKLRRLRTVLGFKKRPPPAA